MDRQTLNLVLLAVGFAVLVALKALLDRWTAAKDLPYGPAETLLTPAELAFHGALSQAVAPEMAVFAKVRLADVLKVRRGTPRSRWQSAFNRISAKHLDFVLVDPKSSRILVAVELDDRSHLSAKRQERDRFLDAALGAASVPLVRITVQKHYPVEPLRDQIRRALGREALDPGSSAPPLRKPHW